jgi:hypothetical protein
LTYVDIRHMVQRLQWVERRAGVPPNRGIRRPVRRTTDLQKEKDMFNKLTSATVVAATLALGFSAVPASAQQNQQRGLVNVAIFEVIDDVTVVVEDVNVSVGVAAGIAANVCGVAVPIAVLAQQVIAGGGEFECTADSGDTGVTISQQ